MSDADDKAFETMQLMDTLGTAIYSEQRMHLKQKYDVDIEDFRYDGWKEYRLCGAKEVIMLCAEEAMNLVNMNRRRWNRKWPRNTPHMCVCLPASHGKTANAPPHAWVEAFRPCPHRKSIVAGGYMHVSTVHMGTHDAKFLFCPFGLDKAVLEVGGAPPTASFVYPFGFDTTDL